MLRTGLKQAEAWLRHGILMVSEAARQTGIGSYTRPWYNKAQERERCQLIQEEIRVEVEYENRSKTLAMCRYGAWNNCLEDHQDRELLRTSQTQVSNPGSA